MHAELLPNGSAGDLLANTEYIVKFKAIPQGDVGHHSRWRIETRDNRGVVNTNDGDLLNFGPVEKVHFTVGMTRAPPSAIIDVSLSVSGNVGGGMFELLLPEGFAPVNIDGQSPREGAS